ncbi:hypothetical protein FJ366_02570 [Candidatus Dependentiae bacterium]|nr:hypothetical protein [Candidatus Dependentiae bacterium]
MNKKNTFIIKSILLSLVLQPLAILAGKTDTKNKFIAEEIPLSKTLQSPLRSNFEHIANYWLENYSRQTLNPTPEEVINNSTQTLLLPLMIEGKRQQLAQPTKRLELLQELQFINTPDKRSVFTGIDKTKTHAGKLSLFNLIACEQTNWETIKQRQEFVRFLTNNQDVLNEIQMHLNEIKKNEFHSIRSILRAEERNAQKELARKEIAQSTWGMFFRIVWATSLVSGLIISSIFGITPTVITSIETIVKVCYGVWLMGILEQSALGSCKLNTFLISLPEKALFQFDAINNLATFLFTTLHVTTTLSIPINLLYTYYYQRYFGMTLGPLFLFGLPFKGESFSFRSVDILNRTAGEQILIYGFGAFWLATSLYAAYKLNQRLDEQNKDFVEAQATAQAFRHAASIHSILQAHDQTQGLYPEIPVNPSPAWYDVINRAHRSTFNETRKPIAPFMDYGTIENFIESCEIPKDEIGQLTRFYGELDAYTSLAQLYQDQKEATNTFKEKVSVSFVNFIENSTESIMHIHNFWHPMIPQERVRPSQLELGGEKHTARNLVITGPNAGGKSVNLKALFSNLLLAQTCGLATAESLSFTPFKKLIGRFKGVDDTASDKSKFMLEAIEMTTLMKEMMDLKPTEHAFVVTDELFTGTEVGPAISLSIELCNEIAKMKNVMYVLATHYKQLTDLSATTGGVFANYKVEVFKDKESNKLVYPYKLTKGIGNTNVAFDIFLEQLDKQGVNNPVLREIIMKAKNRQESIEQSL